jgi:hypothetical protein
MATAGRRSPDNRLGQAQHTAAPNDADAPNPSSETIDKNEHCATRSRYEYLNPIVLREFHLGAGDAMKQRVTLRAYGNDPNGGAKRKDHGEEGRWRCFTRDAITARNDNLDIAWLRDTKAEAEEQLTAPEDIAAAIIGHLKAALEEIETLSEELEPNGIEKSADVAEAAE